MSDLLQTLATIYLVGELVIPPLVIIAIICYCIKQERDDEKLRKRIRK